MMGEMEKLGYRPGLDAIRGAAALMVVLAHTRGALGIPFRGRVGVDVFFVLSGFLITRLLIEERDRTGTVALRRFYLRRARRLLPVLPLALALCALCAWSVGEDGTSILASIGSVVTYTNNYGQAYDADFGRGFGLFWSLAIEEHFYAVWPAVVILVSRSRLWLLCGAFAVVSAAWRFDTISDGHDDLAAYATHLNLDGLLIGALLAIFMAKMGKPTASSVWAAIAVIGAAGLADPFYGLERTAVHLATAVLIVAALHSTVRLPALERVGMVSYGFYLIHSPVLIIVRGLIGGGAVTLPVVLVGVPISYLLAEMSFRLIETRFRTQTILANDRSASVPDVSSAYTAAS